MLHSLMHGFSNSQFAIFVLCTECWKSWFRFLLSSSGDPRNMNNLSFHASHDGYVAWSVVCERPKIKLNELLCALTCLLTWCAWAMCIWAKKSSCHWCNVENNMWLIAYGGASSPWDGKCAFSSLAHIGVRCPKRGSNCHCQTEGLRWGKLARKDVRSLNFQEARWYSFSRPLSTFQRSEMRRLSHTF